MQAACARLVRPCGASVRAHAAYDAAAAHPPDGGNGIGADAGRVIKAEDIRIPARAHIHALILRVAVQDCRELLAGDGVVRAEGRVTVARHNAAAHRPSDSLGEPFSGGNVLKLHRVIHCGSALLTPQDGDDLRTGHAAIRQEARGGNARHQAAFQAEMHAVVVPRRVHCVGIRLDGTGIVPAAGAVAVFFRLIRSGRRSESGYGAGLRLLTAGILTITRLYALGRHRRGRGEHVASPFVSRFRGLYRRIADGTDDRHQAVAVIRRARVRARIAALGADAVRPRMAFILNGHRAAAGPLLFMVCLGLRRPDLFAGVVGIVYGAVGCFTGCAYGLFRARCCAAGVVFLCVDLVAAGAFVPVLCPVVLLYGKVMVEFMRSGLHRVHVP